MRQETDGMFKLFCGAGAGEMFSQIKPYFFVAITIQNTIFYIVYYVSIQVPNHQGKQGKVILFLPAGFDLPYVALQKMFDLPCVVSQNTTQIWKLLLKSKNVQQILLRTHTKKPKIEHCLPAATRQGKLRKLNTHRKLTELT